MDPNTGPAYSPPPAAPKKTSPWVYIGCGCAVLLVVCAVAFVFISKKVVDAGKKMAEGLNNPQVAEERARETLGYSTLPEGYYPAGAISIPFLMDTVFLADHPFEAGARGRRMMGERGFMFINMKQGQLPTDPAARQRMLTNARGQGSWQQGAGLTISTDEQLTNGDLNAGGAHVLYRSSRGQVHVNNESHQGITAFLLPECPDRHIRIGIWFGPDPAPGDPVAKLDTAGTPADPHAIAAFLDHFKLCGNEPLKM